jgi:hypothetical protein
MGFWATACFPCIRCIEDRDLNAATDKNCEKFIPKLKRVKCVSVYDGDTITIAGKLSLTGKPQLFKVGGVSFMILIT